VASTPPPFDPFGWFTPKVTSVGSPTTQPSAPIVVPDLVSKLDALISAQENTNALLTSLLDSMAAQQQYNPYTQGVAASPGTTRPYAVESVVRLPRVVFNAQKGYWCTVRRFTMSELYPPTSIAAGTTVTVAIPPVVLLHPILLTSYLLWGGATCNGLVTLRHNINGVPFVHASATDLTRFFPGLQYLNLLDIAAPIFIETTLAREITFVNTDPGNAHIVSLYQGWLELDYISELDVPQYLR